MKEYNIYLYRERYEAISHIKSLDLEVNENNKNIAIEEFKRIVLNDIIESGNDIIKNLGFDLYNIFYVLEIDEFEELDDGIYMEIGEPIYIDKISLTEKLFKEGEENE